jgi:hypothetical protein
MTDADRPPFDSVVVRLDGRELALGLEEFLRLPFHERVRAILSGGLSFYDGERRIDTQAALVALRRLWPTVSSS